MPHRQGGSQHMKWAAQSSFTLLKYLSSSTGVHTLSAIIFLHFCSHWPPPFFAFTALKMLKIATVFWHLKEVHAFVHGQMVISLVKDNTLRAVWAICENWHTSSRHEYVSVGSPLAEPFISMAWKLDRSLYLWEEVQTSTQSLSAQVCWCPQCVTWKVSMLYTQHVFSYRPSSFTQDEVISVYLPEKNVMKSGFVLPTEDVFQFQGMTSGLSDGSSCDIFPFFFFFLYFKFKSRRPKFLQLSGICPCCCKWCMKTQLKYLKIELKSE